MLQRVRSFWTQARTECSNLQAAQVLVCDPDDVTNMIQSQKDMNCSYLMQCEVNVSCKGIHNNMVIECILVQQTHLLQVSVWSCAQRWVASALAGSLTASTGTSSREQCPRVYIQHEVRTAMHIDM